MELTTELSEVLNTAYTAENLEQSVKFLYDLYHQLNWLEGIPVNDINALIAAAQTTERRILADGLNPKPHNRYRLFLIPSEVKLPLLHPTKMRILLKNLAGQDETENWGHVSSKYYGTSDVPKTTLIINEQELPIDHGFTSDDAGKIGFLIEDTLAPGYNPDMPGSLLANMPWGGERLKAWNDWVIKHTNIKPKAVNYAIQGLLNLGNIKKWDDAFGSTGIIDYISQPFDVERNLYPCGCIDYGEAEWGVRSSNAYAIYAASAVVW